MSSQTWANWTNPSWWNLIVAFPWALGAIMALHEWQADRQVASRQQTAEGVVTAHEPANHNRYRYEFSVGGKSWNGWSIPTNGDYPLGARVVVYYDPVDPTKNALSRFEDVASNALGPVPVMLFGIGFVAWVIARRRRRNSIESATRTAGGPS